MIAATSLHQATEFFIAKVGAALGEGIPAYYHRREAEMDQRIFIDLTGTLGSGCRRYTFREVLDRMLEQGCTSPFSFTHR